MRPPASRTTPGPTRTCVGCRARDSRSALLRITAGADEQGFAVLVPDPAGRLPGRGCWLHPALDCLALAVKRRAFPRALRVSVALDPEPVAAHLQAGAGNN